MQYWKEYEYEPLFADRNYEVYELTYKGPLPAEPRTVALKVQGKAISKHLREIGIDYGSCELICLIELSEHITCEAKRIHIDYRLAANRLHRSKIIQFCTDNGIDKGRIWKGMSYQELIKNTWPFYN